MQDTLAIGRALNPTELTNARYLDALIAFRPETCLRMEESGGAGDGGDTGGDSGAGGQGGDQGAARSGPQMATDSQGRSLGFPSNTPVSDMTDAQQAAYWRNESQKHQGRYKNLTGDRSFDDTKKALEEYARIQKEQMTPAEQALAEAREQGKSEGIKVEREQAARAIFEGALRGGGIKDDDLNELVANFNVAGYIGDNGVDAAKIAAFAARFTPGTGNNGQQQQRRDYGAGSRQSGSPQRGAQGRAEAVRRGFIKADS